MDALAQGKGDAVPADSHPEFSHEPAQLCLRLNPNTDRRDGGQYPPHVHKENNHLFPLVTALEEGVCTSAASLHRVGASQKQELPGALMLPLRSLPDGWHGPADSLAV